MKFTLEIELGNDAMRTARDLAETLIETDNKIRALGVKKANGSKIMDANGNSVGYWDLR